MKSKDRELPAIEYTTNFGRKFSVVGIENPRLAREIAEEHLADQIRKEIEDAKSKR
jgi:hypothetical protein